MTTADAGEHFPQRIKNARNGGRDRRRVCVGDIFGKHRTLGGRMFAVGFDVDGEVFVIAWRGHVVVLDQAFNFRFGDGGDLAFVGIERGETLRRRPFRTDRAEGIDQVLRLVPFLSRLGVGFRNTEAFSELEPKLRMIRRAGFLVDQVLQ